MDYLKSFKKYITEADEELEETNTTGNLDGGEGPPKTPYAFHDDDTKGKKKQKKNSTTATGFEVVNDSMYKKMMSMIHETGQLNETS